MERYSYTTGLKYAFWYEKMALVVVGGVLVYTVYGVVKISAKVVKMITK